MQTHTGLPKVPLRYVLLKHNPLLFQLPLVLLVIRRKDTAKLTVDVDLIFNGALTAVVAQTLPIL